MKKIDSTEQKGIAGEQKPVREDTSIGISRTDKTYVESTAPTKSSKDALAVIIQEHRARNQKPTGPAAAKGAA